MQQHSLLSPNWIEVALPCFRGDVISSPAVVSQGRDDIWLFAREMRQHGMRRLPVVDEEGGLIGIVALDDLLHATAELLDELHYVAARQPRLEEKRRAGRLAAQC